MEAKELAYMAQRPMSSLCHVLKVGMQTQKKEALAVLLPGSPPFLNWICVILNLQLFRRLKQAFRPPSLGPYTHHWQGKAQCMDILDILFNAAAMRTYVQSVCWWGKTVCVVNNIIFFQIVFVCHFCCYTLGRSQTYLLALVIGRLLHVSQMNILFFFLIFWEIIL